jgi:hypothetical protein
VVGHAEIRDLVSVPIDFCVYEEMPGENFKLAHLLGGRLNAARLQFSFSQFLQEKVLHRPQWGGPTPFQLPIPLANNLKALAAFSGVRSGSFSDDVGFFLEDLAAF